MGSHPKEIKHQLTHHLLTQSQGFTLIELLVVIVIVGVLTAVAVPTFINQLRRARIAEAQSALSDVTRHSEIYRVDEGVYPNDYNDIKAGTGYSTDPYSVRAPNYQEPTIEIGAGSSEGILWETTSKGNPYVTGSGANIQCKAGLGDQVFATTIDESCNLNI
jgi:prepilin-type N-terminal cleavage/methylation domain-containing protein